MASKCEVKMSPLNPGALIVLVVYVILASVGSAFSIQHHLSGFSGWASAAYAVIAGIFMLVSIVIFLQILPVLQKK